MDTVPKYNVLTQLTLNDINLKMCKHTWFTYVNLQNLKVLRLEHCPRVEDFLEVLASQDNPAGLEALTFVHDADTLIDPNITALDDLLRAKENTLWKLAISLRNATHLPYPDAIKAHGRTLEVLHLDITSESQPEPAAYQWNSSSPRHYRTCFFTYHYEDFKSIVKSCPRLSQLGIAFATSNLNYQNSAHDAGAEFVEGIDLLATSLNLTVLNILNWPGEPNPGYTIGYHEATELKQARLSSDIFHRLSCSRQANGDLLKTEQHPALEVVAFGVREIGDKPQVSAYFVRSEIKIPGKTFVSAQCVDLQYLQDQDFDVDILDYEARNFDDALRKGMDGSNAWVSDNGW